MLANEEMKERIAVCRARERSSPMSRRLISTPMTAAMSSAHSTEGSHSLENECREVRKMRLAPQTISENIRMKLMFVSTSDCTPLPLSEDVRLYGAADSTIAFPTPIRDRISVQLLTMRFSKASPRIASHPGNCPTDANL